MSFLILSSLVLAAGQTIKIEDLDNNKIQTATLWQKDRVAFDILNGSHTIIIDEIRNKTIDLDIFPYLKDVFYISLRQGTYIKVDLNKDFIIDLIVRLEDINNKNISLKLERVSIDERSYNLKKTNQTNVTFKIDKELEPSRWNGIFIVGIIIIIGVALYYFFNLKPKKRK